MSNSIEFASDDMLKGLADEILNQDTDLVDNGNFYIVTTGDYNLRIGMIGSSNNKIEIMTLNYKDFEYGIRKNSPSARIVLDSIRKKFPNILCIVEDDGIWYAD